MKKYFLASTPTITTRLPILLVALTMPLGITVAQEVKSAGDTAILSDVDVVEDALQILPRDPIGSVFGFGKNVLETPRGVTSISNELLNNVNITEIDDLVAMSPGSFTQSFFGVAGSLDVRGTAGENYFRGVRRIENPGNYPQAIGASDRIDIVRGPASPIYGPSRIGGYLNFVPKSARASTGQYLKDPQGEIGITTGSWDKKVLHAEVGGPGEVFGKQLGYYLYGESENSGSYYENTSTIQSIVQASFDMNLTDHLRTEFGGMYQDFKGNQVAGWNRVTQDLIDHGTYVTGSPLNLDDPTKGFGGNADGLLSQGESFVGGLFNTGLPLNSTLRILNPGTAHINGSQVLVQEDDTLEDKVLTLYGDLIYEIPDGLKITNKMFYESLDNLNENAYGFSQYAKTHLFEDQLNFEIGKRFGSVLDAKVQFGPSIRYQKFEHGDDFTDEYYDRRDITLPGSPVDRRTLATRGQEPYSNLTFGHYLDTGIAVLTDLTWFDKLNLIAGARYDNIEMKSKTPASNVVPFFDSTPGESASDTKGATSWSASLSYSLPFGLRPYFTRAKQSTLITGQGGEVLPKNIEGDTAVADSNLTEFGVKATLLDGHLYVALDHYKQERVDINSQDLVSNNTTRGTGTELEFTWVVVPELSIIGAYTKSKVINLTAIGTGSQTWFFGAADVPGLTPVDLAGGALIGSIPVTSEQDAQKAGIPEKVYSLNAILNFDKLIHGVTASVGFTHADSVYSGFAKGIKLPAYTLVNVGLHYESARWKAGLQVKNLTDERYFRSNFPDLYGDNIVLPELPRNYTLSLGYKF